MSKDPHNNGLSFTDELLNHVYYLRHNLSLQPDSEHHLTAIRYTDIKERREDFLNALVRTVSAWVYSHEKTKQLFDQRLAETNDLSNVVSFITTLAHNKFRPGHPQGQFGELLMFNFLQHFFKAAPLLRKQKITTNGNMERHGADAIHYLKNGEENVIYLGEAKCYESKYQFSAALKQSLESIKKTFEEFDKELDNYVYDDFIDPSLLDVAKAFKEGKLPNVRLELVCLVIYHETATLNLTKEEEIHDSIKEIVIEQCKKLDAKHYDVCRNILNRIQFIVFPSWKLDELLDKFQKKVGSE
jgi:hypothetical protein